MIVLFQTAKLIIYSQLAIVLVRFYLLIFG